MALSTARDLVERFHYAGGGSKTRVYCHGLFRRGQGDCLGVAWWLPPTRVACESVNKVEWKRVLSLSRLVIHPDVPTNACSFLMAKSMKMIAAEGRFVSLVTYADESQGHTGNIYRAAGWEYAGRTGANTRWVDPLTGRQVSALSSVSRTKPEMEALGYVIHGRFHKQKFIKHLSKKPAPGWMRQLGIL